MRLRLITPILVGFLFAGCATEDIAVTAARNIAGALDKARIERSFLFNSSDIFYPHGVPDAPLEFPRLAQSQIDAIQDQLDARLRSLLDFSSRNRALLEGALGHTMVLPGNIRFRVTDTETARAFASEGEIHIDIRVIQAIYRGFLLEALGKPTNDENQREAIRALIDLKSKLASSSGFSTVDQFIGISRGLVSQRGVSDSVITGLLEGLELEFTVAVGRGLQDRYEDALSFLLAHEMSHLLLRHEERTAVLVAEQLTAFLLEREYEADRSAIAIGLLAKNETLQPLNPVYGRTPQGPVLATEINGVWYKNEGSHLCPYETVAHNAGDLAFFFYSYDISGFDSIRKPGQPYPSVSERTARADITRRATMAALTDAQNFAGTCFPSSEVRKKYAADPLTSIRDYWARMLERSKVPIGVPVCTKTTSGGFVSESCTTRLGSPRKSQSEDALLNTKLAEAVFLHHFRRMTK